MGNLQARKMTSSRKGFCALGWDRES